VLLRGLEAEVLCISYDFCSLGVNRIDSCQFLQRPAHLRFSILYGQPIVLSATYAINGFYSHRIDLKRKEKSRIYLIFDPGSTGFKGVSSDAESPAARIIPLLSTPNIFAGARLVTTTTSLPTSSSGL